MAQFPVSDVPSMSLTGELGSAADRGGTHSSRTIMLDELSTLLARDGVPGDIRKLILEDNVLGKATASGRTLTLQRLKELYSFDLAVPIFRVFRTRAT